MNPLVDFIRTCTYHSPCGVLTLGEYRGELCLCDWNVEGRRERVDRRLQRILGVSMHEGETVPLEEACSQLDCYFQGRRKRLDMPLRLCGTPFQCMVWTALQQVPYGQTWTYVQLATALGRPKGVRAVASAVGANPLSLFLPCHRIIGADGSLTGYAGGLAAKRFLLNMER